MEDGDVARPVVGDVALLRARQVQVDVALDLQLMPVKHALVLQAVTDGGVDSRP